MVYVIWLLLGVAAFTFRKNGIVTTLVLAFLLINFCLVTECPDLAGYQDHYLHGYGAAGIREPLYNALTSLFLQAGCSYELFRFLITTASLALVTITLYKLSPYPTLALFMYSIYPMAVDVVQHRFFIAYSIVFWGIGHICQYHRDHKVRHFICLLLSVLAATGMHYSCSLYLFLAFCFLDMDKHKALLFVILPAALAAVLLISKQIGLDIGGSLDSKTTKWTSVVSRRTTAGVARIIVNRSLPMVLTVLLTHICANREYSEMLGAETSCLCKLDSYVYKNEEIPVFYDTRINRCLLCCSLYILVFSVLEVIKTDDFERLARLGLLTCSVLCTRELFYLEERNRIIGFVAYLAMYALYFYMVMFMFTVALGITYYDHVFRRVINSNILWSPLMFF